jgi:hypothetical protein
MIKSFLLFVSLFVTVISCNHSSAATNSTYFASAAISDAGKDYGTITCLIDGKQKTFTLQQSFFEIRLDVDSKGPTDAIEILDGSSKKEGFQFEFKKIGTTKIGGPGRDMDCIINYYNPASKTYTGRGVTVNVVFYDQHHLTATFSGKLVNIYYTGTSDPNPEFIQITNGKMDLHD